MLETIYHTHSVAIVVLIKYHCQNLIHYLNKLCVVIVAHKSSWNLMIKSLRSIKCGFEDFPNEVTAIFGMICLHILKLAVCQYFAWILINMVLTNKLSDYTGLAVDGNASLFYFEFIRKLLTFDQIVSAQYSSVVMLRIFMTATRSSKSEGKENSVRSPPFNNIHIFFHVNNNRDFYIFGNIIFSALSLCFYVFNINQK